MHVRRSLPLLLPLSVTFLAACGGGGHDQPANSVTAPPTVSAVVISPSGTAGLRIGGTLQLTASVQGSAGVSQGVNWNSADAAKASVSNSGLVTAVALSAGTAVCASAAADVSKSMCVTIVVTAAQYSLTVARLDGVQGTPVDGTTTLQAGTSVPYSFSVASTHENLRVLIDGVQSAASGSVAMTANRSIAVLADKRVIVPATVQPGVDAVTNAMRGILGARPLDGYRASNAAVAALAASVPLDSLSRYMRVARLKAFANVNPTTLAIAFKEINDSLAVQSASSAHPLLLAAPAEVTYLFVNGIETSPQDLATTTTKFLPNVVSGAGYPDATNYPVIGVYNPSGNTGDLKEMAALVCMERNADLLTEAALTTVDVVCDSAIRDAANTFDILEAYFQVAMRALKRTPATGTSQKLVDAVRSRLQSSRVVVVAHSQGNLFTDDAYRALERLPDFNPLCVGTVSLAPPLPIRPLAGSKGVSASIVTGKTIKDLLLQYEAYVPGGLPGIGGVPANINPLSAQYNAEYDVYDSIWREILSLGILSELRTYRFLTGGVNLHHVNEDYLTSNFAKTAGDLRTETQNVLTQCIARLDVSSPSTGDIGLALPPLTVRVLAPGDKVGTQVATPINVSLATNSAGATVHGNTTVIPVNGLARFDNLVVDRAGSGLRLQFSAGTVNATSAPFDVRGVPVTPVASISLSPTTAVLVVGATQQLAATLKDAAGNVLTGRSIVWSSSNQAIASVSQSGLVTALATSSQPVSISAASEGKSATAQVTVASPPSSGGVANISAGYDHTCAVNANSLAYCWGNNLSGGIGQSLLSVSDSPVPLPVSTSILFSQVGAGIWRSCGLDVNGMPYCWGIGSDAATGLPSDKPVAVTLSPRFTTMTQGYTFTCGIAVDKDSYCWGSLDGVAMPRTPGRVPATVRFSSINAGVGTICALDANGVAYCWGNNTNGQFGDGQSGNATSIPAPVLTSELFRGISPGGYPTCGVTIAGAAFCWGTQMSGELGTGDGVRQRLTPTRVAGAVAFSTISAGGEHVCALTASGQAYCWGNNSSGQLGIGTGGNRSTPTAVAGGLLFRSISAGASHTCAITINGKAYCWGANNYGQLGDGTYSTELVPVPVRLP